MMESIKTGEIMAAERFINRIPKGMYTSQEMVSFQPKGDRHKNQLLNIWKVINTNGLLVEANKIEYAKKCQIYPGYTHKKPCKCKLIAYNAGLLWVNQ